MATAIVIMDYQNIHLTARDTFAPHGLPAHECLIHPLRFAQQVLVTRERRLAVKAMTNPAAGPAERLELLRVEAYRGQPSNHEQPNLYRYSLAQKAEWTRDPRVVVEYRTLRYFWEEGVRVAQEKGIDVRVALAVVRAVTMREADVVILASHDTDLEPALDAAVEWGGSRVETTGWTGSRVLRPRVGVRHTSLGPQEFLMTRDRRDYTQAAA